MSNVKCLWTKIGNSLKSFESIRKHYSISKNEKFCASHSFIPVIHSFFHSFIHSFIHSFCFILFTALSPTKDRFSVRPIKTCTLKISFCCGRPFILIDMNLSCRDKIKVENLTGNGITAHWIKIMGTYDGTSRRVGGSAISTYNIGLLYQNFKQVCINIFWETPLCINAPSHFVNIIIQHY